MSASRPAVRWTRVVVISLCTGVLMVPTLWLYHMAGRNDATGGELLFGFAWGVAIGAFVAIARPDLFSGRDADGVD